MKHRTATQQLPDLPPLQGHAETGFELVREEFQRNFKERGEWGAACAVYHRGVMVVDLWGGFRDIRTRAPWSQDTMVVVFSVTKGMAAAVMAVAHSRGLMDLDRSVAMYWPDFAQFGKREITVRQLLGHQAGLVALDRRLDTAMLSDHDRMARLLEQQTPAWRPGSRHGYHTLTLGWYQNELVRRIDPKGRSLGRFFQDEIARPLGVEFYIGLPTEIDEERLAVVKGFPRVAVLANLGSLPFKMVLAGLWPSSLAAKSIQSLRLGNPARIGDRAFRHVEIPSANGIGQARALAKIYGVLASGGNELGISSRTMREIVEPPPAPTAGSQDMILKIDTKYSLGFSRPSRDLSFGQSNRAFGCPGAGGAFAMGDPDNELGFAYVTNRMGFRLFDDAREKALRDACYRCLARK